MKERRNTCYDYFNDFVQLCVSYLNFYDPCNTSKVISIAIRPHKRLASAYTFASNWNQFSALRERTSVEMYQDESPRMLSGRAGVWYNNPWIEITFKSDAQPKAQRARRSFVC